VQTGGYLESVRILVVEDNAFARRIVVELLKQLGASNFIIAKDGEEAWQEIKKEMPDIVLLDWEMGPVDGHQFLRRVRHDPGSPNPYLPIIMVTGFADRWHVFQARDAGVNEYVIKPISAKALLDRIQAVIERPRRFVRIGKFFGPDRRRKEKMFLGPDKRGWRANPPRLKSPSPPTCAKRKSTRCSIPTTCPRPRPRTRNRPIRSRRRKFASGRLAHMGLDQNLGDLHGVERGALAQVVGHDPER
jgi:CheY-like chemotaxis protein